MTTTLLHRRLDKIEAAVMPKVMKPLRILFQPGTDDPAAWAAHEAVITDARVRDEWFCVVRFVAPGGKRESREIEGVQYFDTDWEAGLAALGPDGVQDLLDSLLGNVFGVASGQTEDD
jgi:hypothetical protein